MTKMLVLWTPHQNNVQFLEVHLMVIFELMLRETFLTLVADLVEAVLFICVTLMEDILAVRAELSS